MLKIRPREDFSHKRIMAGYSSSDLAKAAGISRQAVYQFESGIIGVSPDRAKKMCEALGFEFDELFTIE